MDVYTPNFFNGLLKDILTEAVEEACFSNDPAHSLCLLFNQLFVSYNTHFETFEISPKAYDSLHNSWAIRPLLGYKLISLYSVGGCTEMRIKNE